MHILISNDDGYLATGLVALVDAIAPLGKVTVIAPESNRSGASNSLTLDRPLSIRKASNGFYFVNGTPSDCVHLAFTHLLDSPPDIVLSGINNGQNMGDDTLYSGTVAAAMEGFLFGVPAIAFSHVDKGHAHVQDAAQMALRITQRMLDQPVHQLWNVNIPNLPLDQLKGVRTARLGKRHASEPAIPTKTPGGDTVLWIGPAGPARDTGQGTDFDLTERGYVAVTPLQIDLTAHQQLTDVQSRLGALIAP